MAVRFYLDNRPNKSGDHPIRVGISLNNDRLLTSTGFSIAPEKWDIDNQRVKQGCSNAKKETYTVINKRLNDIVGVFYKIETLLQLGDITNENVNIKAIYDENFSKKSQSEVKEKNLFDYIDDFTAEMGKENNWTNAVFDKFNALKNHLSNFKPDLNFANLDKIGLTEFVNYLQGVQVSGKKHENRDTRVFGMRNSSIKKQLGFLKWFLRWATSKGYNNETAFLTFNPKLKTSGNKVIFLDWQELMTIYYFDFFTAKKTVFDEDGEKEVDIDPVQANALDQVRDVFCFCCFTSLRYSDVANLKRSNIKSNHIEITTVKTNDALTIDLNDYSRAILDKYKNEDYFHDLALPVISNQRMNDHLKEMGKICGINKPETITYYKGNQRFDEVFPKYALIGTHTGRRTFISNAIMMGIAPQIVMKWTGHSDYKAMKPYIDIADKAKSEAMKMFNKKITDKL